MSIQTTIQQIKAELPSSTRLIAVSKYHPSEMIRQAYDAGQRIFGESHVQELQQKVGELPSDIEWHFIGHLQTNKVKYIAPYVSLIHAVDSFRLLQEIEKQGARCNRRIRVLLQLHLAQEDTKFGLTPEECDAMLAEGLWRQMPHVDICGIMCMASNVDDDEQILNEFRAGRQYFEHARQTFFPSQPSFCECSMGMSDDYPLAVQQGSTLVRIGSKIFGPRVY